MTANVVDTGDKFLTGVKDNREQLWPGDNDIVKLSPVTMTPAINLLPKTRTRTKGGGELPRIGES